MYPTLRPSLKHPLPPFVPRGVVLPAGWSAERAALDERTRRVLAAWSDEALYYALVLYRNATEHRTGPVLWADLAPYLQALMLNPKALVRRYGESDLDEALDLLRTLREHPDNT